MTVRPSTEGDVEAVRELRLEALQLHPEAFGSSFEEESAFDAATWRARSLSSERFTLFLAEHEGQLLGMAGLLLDDKLKTRHIGRLVSVYVRPAVRGHGVAQNLIAACLERAVGAGATVVFLGVGSGNEPALRCYRRAGFTEYGLEPRSLRVEGVYVDETLMAILL